VATRHAIGIDLGTTNCACFSPMPPDAWALLRRARVEIPRLCTSPFVPGKRKDSGGEFAFLGKIEKRRKQKSLFDSSRCGQLRNGTDVPRAVFEVAP
jgi:hypothetical protein